MGGKCEDLHLLRWDSTDDKHRNAGFQQLHSLSYKECEVQIAKAEILSAMF